MGAEKKERSHTELAAAAEPLIKWLNEHARCGEDSEPALLGGRLAEALADLWQQPLPPLPKPTGIAEVANLLAERLIFRS